MKCREILIYVILTRTASSLKPIGFAVDEHYPSDNINGAGGITLVNINGSVDDFIKTFQIDDIIQINSPNPISFINQSINSIADRVQGLQTVVPVDIEDLPAADAVHQQPEEDLKQYSFSGEDDSIRTLFKRSIKNSNEDDEFGPSDEISNPGEIHQAYAYFKSVIDVMRDSFMVFLEKSLRKLNDAYERVKTIMKVKDDNMKIDNKEEEMMDKSSEGKPSNDYINFDEDIDLINISTTIRAQNGPNDIDKDQSTPTEEFFSTVLPQRNVLKTDNKATVLNDNVNGRKNDLDNGVSLHEKTRLDTSTISNINSDSDFKNFLLSTLVTKVSLLKKNKNEVEEITEHDEIEATTNFDDQAFESDTNFENFLLSTLSQRDTIMIKEEDLTTQHELPGIIVRAKENDNAEQAEIEANHTSELPVSIYDSDYVKIHHSTLSTHGSIMVEGENSVTNDELPENAETVEATSMLKEITQTDVDLDKILLSTLRTRAFILQKRESTTIFAEKDIEEEKEFKNENEETPFHEDYKDDNLFVENNENFSKPLEKEFKDGSNNALGQLSPSTEHEGLISINNGFSEQEIVLNDATETAVTTTVNSNDDYGNGYETFDQYSNLNKNDYLIFESQGMKKSKGLNQNNDYQKEYETYFNDYSNSKSTDYQSEQDLKPGFLTTYKADLNDYSTGKNYDTGENLYDNIKISTGNYYSNDYMYAEDEVRNLEYENPVHKDKIGNDKKENDYQYEYEDSTNLVTPNFSTKDEKDGYDNDKDYLQVYVNDNDYFEPDSSTQGKTDYVSGKENGDQIVESDYEFSQDDTINQEIKDQEDFSVYESENGYDYVYSVYENKNFNNENNDIHLEANKNSFSKHSNFVPSTFKRDKSTPLENEAQGGKLIEAGTNYMDDAGFADNEHDLSNNDNATGASTENEHDSSDNGNATGAPTENEHDLSDNDNSTGAPTENEHDLSDNDNSTGAPTENEHDLSDNDNALGAPMEKQNESTQPTEIPIKVENSEESTETIEMRSDSLVLASEDDKVVVVEGVETDDPVELDPDTFDKLDSENETIDKDLLLAIPVVDRMTQKKTFYMVKLPNYIRKDILVNQKRMEDKDGEGDVIENSEESTDTIMSAGNIDQDDTNPEASSDTLEENSTDSMSAEIVSENSTKISMSVEEDIQDKIDIESSSISEGNEIRNRIDPTGSEETETKRSTRAKARMIPNTNDAEDSTVNENDDQNENEKDLESSTKSDTVEIEEDSTKDYSEIPSSAHIIGKIDTVTESSTTNENENDMEISSISEEGEIEAAHDLVITIVPVDKTTTFANDKETVSANDFETSTVLEDKEMNSESKDDLNLELTVGDIEDVNPITRSNSESSEMTTLFDDKTTGNKTRLEISTISWSTEVTSEDEYTISTVNEEEIKNKDELEISTFATVKDTINDLKFSTSGNSELARNVNEFASSTIGDDKATFDDNELEIRTDGEIEESRNENGLESSTAGDDKDISNENDTPGENKDIGNKNALELSTIGDDRDVSENTDLEISTDGKNESIGNEKDSESYAMESEYRETTEYMN